MHLHKIYIGNIAYSLTETDLFDFFADCGAILKVQLIRNHETQQSQGFGFVFFETAEEMEKALQKNGQRLAGRALQVERAKQE